MQSSFDRHNFSEGGPVFEKTVNVFVLETDIVQNTGIKCQTKIPLSCTLYPD